MDGDIKPPAAPRSAAADIVAREAVGVPGGAAAPPKTLRWLAIVGLLLALVLGGLYGFNKMRERGIAAFFANSKPPPAQISAVIAETAEVPRYATGIGSLVAVHQVTVTPEIGGRVSGILFTAGAAVKAGDPLVQLNDAPERGDLLNYEAQARLAAITLERSQQLARRQNAAQSTVDQNQSQLDQMRALIAKTQAIINQKLVRAPFTGRLGVRQIELGQYLNAGAAIVTLTDLENLYVNFTLPSQRRSEIAVGQRVQVTTDAFAGRIFNATVSTIEPQISADTRTMMVQATLANPDGALLPGMFVDAAVVLPPELDRVVLPETAIDHTLYGDSVFVIRPDGTDASGQPILKAFRTTVKVGASWNNKVAILSGVKPGEQIVAAGQVKLQDKSPVIVTGNAPPQPPVHPTPQ